LLDANLAFVAVACSHIRTITYAPKAERIGFCITFDVGTGQNTMVVDRTQTISVISKPEWCIISSTACATQTETILYVFAQSFCLCPSHERHKHQAQDDNYAIAISHSSLFVFNALSNRLLKRLLPLSYIQPHLLKYFTTLIMCASESCQL
jgi:hypothetical protein